jgi:hypothetical protein
LMKIQVYFTHWCKKDLTFCLGWAQWWISSNPAPP